MLWHKVIYVNEISFMKRLFIDMISEIDVSDVHCK